MPTVNPGNLLDANCQLPIANRQQPIAFAPSPHPTCRKLNKPFITDASSLGSQNQAAHRHAIPPHGVADCGLFCFVSQAHRPGGKGTGQIGLSALFPVSDSHRMGHVNKSIAIGNWRLAFGGWP